MSRRAAAEWLGTTSFVFEYTILHTASCALHAMHCDDGLVIELRKSVRFAIVLQRHRVDLNNSVTAHLHKTQRLRAAYMDEG